MVTAVKKSRMSVGGYAKVGDGRRFTVPLYIHADRLTIAPDDGIECATVEVQLFSKGSTNSKWYVVAVDMDALEFALPSLGRKGGASKAPILTAIIKALTGESIDAREVKGWGNWFNAAIVKSALWGE